MAKGAARVTDPMRFHLTSTPSGRPVMYGWWGDAATAGYDGAKWGLAQVVWADYSL